MLGSTTMPRESGWATQWKRYIEDKKWGDNVVDVAPVILADMLNTKLQVITNAGDKAQISTFNSQGDRKVAVVLEKAHYCYVDMEAASIRVRDWLNGDGVETCIANSKVDNVKVEYRRPTMVIPFKSDVTTKKILAAKSALTINNEFNIVFKTEGRLFDLVRRTRDKQKVIVVVPKLVNKPVDKEQAKSVAGLVYQATCIECRSRGEEICYVGETGRPLSVRMGEHCRKITIEKAGEPNASAIGQHSLEYHGKQPSISNWEFKILHFLTKTQDRKTLEAYEIQKGKPVLNRDEGVHVILLNTKV